MGNSLRRFGPQDRAAVLELSRRALQRPQEQVGNPIWTTVEELESELARQKELEQALRNTLLSAERMADDMRAQARREADVIVAEARSAARDIVSGAETERERVRTEIRRLQEVETGVRADYRAFLLAALERLEGDTEERQAAGQAA